MEDKLGMAKFKMNYLGEGLLEQFYLIGQNSGWPILGM